MRHDEEATFDEFVWHATEADRLADALHPEGALASVNDLRGLKYEELAAYMDRHIADACGLSAAMLGKP